MKVFYAFKSSITLDTQFKQTNFAPVDSDIDTEDGATMIGELHLEQHFPTLPFSIIVPASSASIQIINPFIFFLSGEAGIKPATSYDQRHCPAQLFIFDWLPINISINLPVFCLGLIISVTMWIMYVDDIKAAIFITVVMSFKRCATFSYTNSYTFF